MDYRNEANLRDLAALTPEERARSAKFEASDPNLRELRAEIDKQTDPQKRAILQNEYNRLTGQEYQPETAPQPPGRRRSLADADAPRYVPADDLATPAAAPAASGERTIKRSKAYLDLIASAQEPPAEPPPPSTMERVGQFAKRTLGDVADAATSWATKDRAAAAPGQVGAVGAMGGQRALPGMEPEAAPVPPNTYQASGPGGVLRDIRDNEAARAQRLAPPPPSVLQNPDGSGVQVPERTGGFTPQEMAEGSVAPWKLEEQRRMGEYVAPRNPQEARPFDTAQNIAQDVREFTDNPVARGAVAGFSQLGQTGIGAVRLAADLVGAEDVAGFSRGASRIADTVGQGATSDLKGNEKLVADVTSSIMNSAPAVAIGAIGGRGLTTLFAQSTLAEYNAGRDAGFDVGASLGRAGIMGTAEALGERFGFSEQLKLIKAVTKGLPQGELAKVMGAMIAKEIPGEQLTTAMQFLADKIGPAALRPNATIEDYLNAAGETLKVTVAQTAVMGGGPAAIVTGRNQAAAADQAIERSAMTQAERAAEDAGFLRPTERRKQLDTSLDDLAAEYGISPKAVKAIREQAARKPLDQLAGFYKRAVQSLAKLGLTGKPVDEAGLSVLEQPPPQASVSVPRETPQETVSQPAAPADDTGPIPAEEVLGAPAADEPTAPTPQSSQDLAGEPINRNWTAFAPESGSLNLPREQLPQIKAEHRGALVNFLGARGVTHETDAELDPRTLKPTQAEFSPAKVQKAREFEGGDRSILVSSDGYVLDGHHQWLAKLDAGQPVKAIRLNAPIQDLLRLAHQFPSSTTARGATRATPINAGAPTPQPASGDAVAGGPAPVAPAPSAQPRVIARAGRAPNSAEPIELRANPDGTATPYMGGKAMLDYESGNPIVLPGDVSDLDAKKAIREAGAVSDRTRFFPAGARADQAAADLEAGLKELGGVMGKGAEAPAPAPAPKPDQRAARAKARMALDPVNDTVLQALAKMGGIRRDVVASEFGLKPEELKHTVKVGGLNGFPFRKTDGMDLDRAMTNLREAGYFAGVADEDVRAAFEQAIYDELGGGRTLTVQGQMADAQRQAEERAQEEEAAARAEYDEEAQAERAAIMAEAGLTEQDMAALDDDDLDIDAKSNVSTEAFLRAMGASEQEIQDALAEEARRANGRGQEAGQAAGEEALAPAGAGSGQARPGAAEDEGLTLDAQTSDDLKAKTEREAAAAELDQRQQIDAERDLFGLEQQAPQETRADTTGDMFGGPSVEDVQRAKKPGRASTPTGPDLFGEPQSAADRAEDRDRRAGELAAKYGLKPSMYLDKPLPYAWGRTFADGDSGVSMQASFDQNGAETFTVTRSPTFEEVEAGTLFETSTAHKSIAAAERDIAEWVAQRDGRKPPPAAEALPTGLVEIPADADAVAEAIRNQAQGDDERLTALFGPQDERVSLPRIMGGKVPAGVEFMTPEQAKAELAKWKAEAKRQNKKLAGENGNRTVISLFDASGVLAQPWAEAGYNVVAYDLQTGTDISQFDAQNLLEQHGNDEVFAILAQPPCTDFAASGARWWKDKDEDGRTKASTELVMQVLRTVELFRPSVWVMENPVGRIQEAAKLPDPTLQFDPWHYGDPYTKRTLLWGRFDPNLPTAMVEPTDGSKMHRMSSSAKYERSLTSEPFAYAFFMANNADAMGPAGRLAAEFAGVERELFDAAVAAGHSEYDIRSAVDDPYYENDLETVREELAKMAPTPPPKPSVRPEELIALRKRASILKSLLECVSA